MAESVEKVIYKQGPETLDRSISASENNSVLVIGARGAGKTLLVEHVLAGLQSQYQRQRRSDRAVSRGESGGVATPTSARLQRALAELYFEFLLQLPAAELPVSQMAKSCSNLELAVQIATPPLSDSQRGNLLELLSF